MNPEDNTLIPCIDFPTILAQDQNFIDLSEYWDAALGTGLTRLKASAFYRERV